MTLTDKQKKDYVDDLGIHCPYCDSDDIWGDDWDFGTGEFWQTIKCRECGKKWTDVYTLSAIEEREESDGD